MTTGATGGGWQINDKRTDMRQEEEREMKAWENFSGGQGARNGGISEGGERGGDQIHQLDGKTYHISLSKKGQNLVTP